MLELARNPRPRQVPFKSDPIVLEAHGSDDAERLDDCALTKRLHRVFSEDFLL